MFLISRFAFKEKRMGRLSEALVASINPFHVFHASGNHSLSTCNDLQASRLRDWFSKGFHHPPSSWPFSHVIHFVASAAG